MTHHVRLKAYQVSGTIHLRCINLNLVSIPLEFQCGEVISGTAHVC